MSELKSKKKKNVNHLLNISKTKLKNIVQNTPVYKNIDPANKIRKQQQNFREKINYRLHNNSSNAHLKTKNKLKDINITDLHKAGILSEIQMSYLNKINNTTRNPKKIKRIAEHAYDEIGTSANVIIIYASIYMHSEKYWKNNFLKWQNLSGNSCLSAKNIAGSKFKTINIAETPDGKSIKQQLKDVFETDAKAGATTFAVTLSQAASDGELELATVAGPEGWLLEGIKDLGMAGIGAASASAVQSFFE